MKELGGSLPRKVEVVPYDAEWTVFFAAEKERIGTVLGHRLFEIHHIGSTSVPGLAAKPIIDMMPVVHDINKIDECNHGMEELGYTVMGEYGIPGRRFFYRRAENNSCNVHIFQRGDPNVERHIAFRDYLQAFPRIAEEYGQIKKELAVKFTWDIESYINGKDPFIKETEKRAVAWYRANRMEES
jgi:GrpB-like predicted nucleotidyltransferase (UPF0157 family)